MVKSLAIFGLLMASINGLTQQSPMKSPLLDHLAGKWVLHGTISGQSKPAIHDVDTVWVIEHHYLRTHEVSREKNAQGQPQYEAIVFIGWNEETKQYGCVWLDSFGGLSVQSIGTATPQQNAIHFIFKDEKGEIDFSNDFVYHPNNNTWEWRMNNVQNGVYKPFAHMVLTRK